MSYEYSKEIKNRTLLRTNAKHKIQTFNFDKSNNSDRLESKIKKRTQM